MLRVGLLRVCLYLVLLGLTLAEEGTSAVRTPTNILGRGAKKALHVVPIYAYVNAILPGRASIGFPCRRSRTDPAKVGAYRKKFPEHAQGHPSSTQIKAHTEQTHTEQAHTRKKADVKHASAKNPAPCRVFC